jgi:hypothetical protein
MATPPTGQAGSRSIGLEVEPVSSQCATWADPWDQAAKKPPVPSGAVAG